MTLRCAVVLGLLIAVPAQAAYPVLDGDQPSNYAFGPDGELAHVKDSPCSAANLYATFAVYDASGTLAWQLRSDDQTGLDPSCGATPGFDGDGDVYLIMHARDAGNSSPQRYYVSFSPSGAFRWKQPVIYGTHYRRFPAYSANPWFSQPNGLMTVVDASDTSNGLQGILRSFDRTDGHVVFSVPMSQAQLRGSTYGVPLGDGPTLGLLTQGSGRYGIDLVDEASGAVIDPWTSSINDTTDGVNPGGWFIHNGRSVLIGRLNVTRGPDPCYITSGFTVQTHSALRSDWTFRSPEACQHNIYPGASNDNQLNRPGPDGGAVVMGSAYTGVVGDDVTRFNDDGAVAWVQDVVGPQQPDDQDHVRDVAVGSDGTVAVLVDVARKNTNAASGGVQEVAQVRLLRSSDGAVLRPPIEFQSSDDKVNIDSESVHAVQNAVVVQIRATDAHANSVSSLERVAVAGMGADTRDQWSTGMQPPQPDPPPIPLPIPPSPPPGPTTYVALGDSFSSGEGVTPFFSGTDFGDTKHGDHEGCHRSQKAYSQLINPADLAALMLPFKTIFVACSGAVISDLFRRSHDGYAGEGNQLAAAAAARPRLETLTIGGNDVGFTDIIDACLSGPRALIDIFHSGKGCRTRLDKRVKAKVANLRSPSNPDRLSVVYAKASATLAPAGTLLILNYPDVLGSRKKNGRVQSCHVGTLYTAYYSFASDDLLWLSKTTRGMNQAIKSEVAVARTSGANVRLVDVARRFTGHGLCDNAEKYQSNPRKTWFNKLSFRNKSLTSGPAPWPGSFHPNSTGQRRMASAIDASSPF